jgi:hypothetical protein
MTVLLCLSAVLLGYAARVAQERYLQIRRERALQALSGELPDWEKRARELEDYADRSEIDGDPQRAKVSRKKAARMRRVALRRLGRGRAALPS